jgi:hypothetical protein
VDSLEELYAIECSPEGKLNAYGDGSGQRTHGMTVLVRDGAPEAWYEMRLEIAGYWQLNESARVAALLDNANWRRVSATSTPGAGGGSAAKGVKINFPGRYSAANRVHALPAGTRSLDLKTGAGREMEPELDYTLNLLSTPPTLTVMASLALYEGVRLWGYYYLASSRTKVALGTYDAAHTQFTLAVGVREVSVFFGTGLELEPAVDYTFDSTARLLTVTADLYRYSGKRLWLWAYK